MGLQLETMLGGIMASIKLGNAFDTQKLLDNIGSLQALVRQQGENAFFIGGKRPTSQADSWFLDSYMLAIGGSVRNILPVKARNNRQLAARGARKTLIPPAPFTQAIHRRLADEHDRAPTMSAQELIETLKAQDARMREKYYQTGAVSENTSPLELAIALFNAEALTVGQVDYLAVVKPACGGLKAVQDAMGGPSSDVGKLTEGLDPSEVTVGRVFAEGVLRNEVKMAKLARTFGRALGAQGLVMSSSGDLAT